MKIVITGSSGFVGQNFLKYNQPHSCVEADLLVQKIDEICFDGSDSVLHFAALVHQMKGAPEKKYFEVNSNLAFETVKKAKEVGVSQFLYIRLKV